MKRYLTGVSLLLWASVLSQNSAFAGGDELILINEILALNTAGLTDESGEHEDWIELYNPGGSEIDLNGFYITDDPLDPFKWLLQSEGGEGLELGAGAYLILYADNEPQEGSLHLGFSLDHEGEYVGLFTSEGVMIDEISFGIQGADVSYGLQPGESTWNYFLTPSPNAANSGMTVLGILSPPVITASSVLSETTVELNATHPEPLAELRYTLDGSEPNLLSPVYSSMVAVEPGQLFRVKAFLTGYAPSRSAARAVLPNQELALDVLSVYGSEQDLFGSGNGIYNHPFSNIERMVHVVLFENGSPVLDQWAGMKIHAPDSRDQKSFRLYARSEYGADRFDLPVFDEKNIDSYKRLIVRNAGNDGVELGETGLRDPLISRLYGSISDQYGYAAHKPVNVFLNGEYWGIYNLRERQDEYFMMDNFGLTEGSYELLERTASVSSTYEALVGDWDDFNALEEAAILLDLSEPENYEMISDWMDIPNFVDYQAIEILICNQDWLSNNMKFWRTYDGTHKWQWLIWDSDWGFGTFYPSYVHGYPDWNALNFALSNWGGWTTQVETELLQNLVQNPEFLAYFCTRSADLSNSYLRPDRIDQLWNQMTSEVAPDMPLQCERWESTMPDWNQEVEYVSDFVSARKSYFLEHFAERFELGEIHTITLEVDPPGAGYIEINTIHTDEEPWSGQYFSGLPVELSAVPNPGYSFLEWEEIGINPDLSVLLEGDSTLTALFTPSETQILPIINEIHYNPSANWNSGEWIELYNPGLLPVDLGAWTLGTDEGELCTFSSGTILAPGEYAVVCADSLAFRDYYPDLPILPIQLNGDLQDQSGLIYLLENGQSVADYVNYDSEGQWPSSPDGQGPSLELVSPELNNNLGQNWFARPEPSGSPGQPNLVSSVLDLARECKALAYPQPAEEEVQLLIECPDSGMEWLEVYDGSGRLVLNRFLGQMGGPALIRINRSELGSGSIFHYRVPGRDRNFSGKILFK